MPRPTYSDDFKREAVRLVTEQGLSRKRVAHNLGVSIGALRNWLARLTDGPVLPAATLPADEQIRQFRRELERVRMERDILKKAVGMGGRPPALSQMPPQS